MIAWETREGNLDPVSLQPHVGQDLVHAGIEAQILPVEGVSDEDHVADAGLDGSFQPLDRLVDTTECDEGDHEVEVEGEFRAGPLQLLELGEVAQGLLRPARPREQVRSGAQAPHTSGRKRPVAQEFFDGPVVFFQAVVGLGTPLDGGAEGGVDFECAIVVDQALPGPSREDVRSTQEVEGEQRERVE